MGNIVPISTQNVDRSSVRVGELERDAAAFISEKHQSEVDEKTKAVLKYIKEEREKLNKQGQQRLFVCYIFIKEVFLL